MSGDFLMEFFSAWAGGRIRETAQDSSLATYADKIDKAMCRIDWGRDAQAISAQIRGLDPMPGAFSTIGENNLKLFSSTFTEEASGDGVPGRIISSAQGMLRIKTGRGIIEVKEVQYPGKKRLPVKDFLLGFNLPEGTILGK
jgi:methionyl-tRNA formyltransferase